MKLSMILAVGCLLFAIGLIATNHHRCGGDGAQEYSVVSVLMDLKNNLMNIMNNQQQLLELHHSQLTVQTVILKV